VILNKSTKWKGGIKNIANYCPMLNWN